jgi:two-component system, sensor histidine kinase PdtaS
VRDNGGGIPEGKTLDGLGTQIVRTLVQGELGGLIEWRSPAENGTEVILTIPLQYLHEKGRVAELPSV